MGKVYWFIFKFKKLNLDMIKYLWIFTNIWLFICNFSVVTGNSFLFLSFFCSLLIVTVICAWICDLQVISDLRKSLDLSSCVLPLQIHSSQKKIKSQVQARYLNRFMWFYKGKIRQENLKCSSSGLSGTIGFIHRPNLFCGKAWMPLFLPACTNTAHLSLLVQAASPAMDVAPLEPSASMSAWG